MPRAGPPQPTTARTRPGPDTRGPGGWRRDATGSAALLTLGVVALTAALLTGTARLGSAALEHQRAQAAADLAALAGAAAGPGDAARLARRNGAARDVPMRQRIAQAALALDALRCNALRVLASAGAHAGPPSREALIAKYAWSNWRRDFGRLAADVLGSAADLIDDDADAQVLRAVWLASRADTIYAGANEIQLNLISERALGMPR